MAENCPFPIYNQWETQRYIRWLRKEVTPPHVFSWDLLDQLGVSAELASYLDVLGLSDYARMNHEGSSMLTREFLTTLYMPNDHSYIDFRLMGQQRRMPFAELCLILGCHSPNRGICAFTDSFNPRQTWVELTGYDNWETGGVSSAFLRAHVLAILHKFLAFAISGNVEGNKVNKTELFLLDCARKGIRVCAASFILQSFSTVLCNFRCRPTLPMVVSAIAENYWLTPAQCYGNDDLLEPVPLDFSELRRARILTRQCGWYPVERRPAVISYVNSILAAQHTNENSSDDDEDEEMPQQPGRASTSTAQGTGAPDPLVAQFAAFRDDIRHLRNQHEERSDAHDRRLDRIENLLQEQNQRLAQQSEEARETNRRVSELADQWSSWALFSSGGSSSAPPPDDQQ